MAATIAPLGFPELFLFISVVMLFVGLCMTAGTDPPRPAGRRVLRYSVYLFLSGIAYVVAIDLPANDPLLSARSLLLKITTLSFLVTVVMLSERDARQPAGDRTWPGALLCFILILVLIAYRAISLQFFS